MLSGITNLLKQFLSPKAVFGFRASPKLQSFALELNPALQDSLVLHLNL